MQYGSYQVFVNVAMIEKERLFEQLARESAARSATVEVEPRRSGRLRSLLGQHRPTPFAS